MTGAHPAPVFVVGDIAHVVQAILDAPVSSHEHEHEFDAGLLGRQGGQAVDGLVLDFAGFAAPAFALDAKGDLAMGQGSLVGVGAEVDDPASATTARSSRSADPPREATPHRRRN